ncbi:MAG: winged helix-turn-helix transcriptional regulator [Clostridia bacterium]|nr:winged helix-turn-helix transcriptional regulator [Clostridia bacterium]
MTGNERRNEILLFVNRYNDSNGYSPSYREIADAVGLKSVSTVAYYVKQLEKDGRLVQRRGQKCRSIGTARRVCLRIPEGKDESTQRVAVRIADGGVLEMDLSVVRTDEGQAAVTFSGVMDATRLKKPVGRVVFCSVETEELK